jgi:hypothetical protein
MVRFVEVRSFFILKHYFLQNPVLGSFLVELKENHEDLQSNDAKGSCFRRKVQSGES